MDEDEKPAELNEEAEQQDGEQPTGEEEKTQEEPPQGNFPKLSICDMIKENESDVVGIMISNCRLEKLTNS